LFSDFVEWITGGGEEAVSKLVSDELREQLAEGFSSADRLNLALSAGANPGDLRGYALLSSASGGKMKQVGEIISNAIDSYNDTLSDEAKKIKVVPADAWSFAFSTETISGTGLIKGPITLSAAFGDDRALVGVMSPSLLSEPFSSDSNLYSSLIGDGNVMETVYLDTRAIRKALGSLIEKGARSGQATSLVALLVVPLMDFRELGAQTFSPRHFRFTFRTGWLDFDDRDLIQSFMR
jgi:hypothetical protein